MQGCSDQALLLEDEGHRFCFHLFLFNNSIFRCQAGEEEPLTSCLQQTLAYSGFDLYSLGSFLASGSLTSVLEQRFKEKEVRLPSQIRCQDLTEMIKQHFGNTTWAKLDNRRVRCGKKKTLYSWYPNTGQV